MWLYVPNCDPGLSPDPASSPSAQGGADLILASNWQCQALASSAWWRGKPSPSRTWSQRCERVSWLRLLCGAMPEPSRAAHGVAAWTASLAAFPASRTASPESASPSSTSATSGDRPGGSSSRPGRGSSSSKMSAACSHRAVPSGFGETFADLVSRSRSDYSRRRKSARAMSVSASSSSASMTAWPTPAAMDATRDGAHLRQMTIDAAERGARKGISLCHEVYRWPTPAARDWKGANSEEHLERSTGSLHLDQLPNFVQHLWRTLGAADSERGSNGTWQPKPKAGQHSLRHQTDRWEHPYSPLALTTVKTGKPSSKERRSLNPLFVEWLMGWPPGWTLLVSSDFACSATALSHFKQRMRGALSQLVLHDAPPAQASLFG